MVSAAGDSVAAATSSSGKGGAAAPRAIAAAPELNGELPATVGNLVTSSTGPLPRENGEIAVEPDDDAAVDTTAKGRTACTPPPLLV